MLKIVDDVPLTCFVSKVPNSSLLCVALPVPVGRDIACYDFLARLLEHGCSRWRGAGAVKALMQELGGVEFTPVLMRSGARAFVCLLFLIPYQHEIEQKKILRKALRFCNCLLNHPIVSDSSFEREFQKEKRDYEDFLSACLENPTISATEKFLQLYFRNSPYGTSPFSTRASLRTLKLSGCERLARSLLKEKPKILYAGTLAHSTISRSFGGSFKLHAFSFGDFVQDSPAAPAHPKRLFVRRSFTASCDAAVIAVNAARCSPAEFRILQTVFGDSPASLPFIKFREKLQLSYSLVSHADIESRTVLTTLLLPHGSAAPFKRGFDEICSRDNVLSHARTSLTKWKELALNELAQSMDTPAGFIKNWICHPGAAYSEVLDGIRKLAVGDLEKVLAEIRLAAAYFKSDGNR